MAHEPDRAESTASGKLRIYFLPNLLTAANLFCGFLALTKIVEANPSSPTFHDSIKIAMFYILLACIFDLLDGRVARMGGYESPFGREFDSLADIISFGAAPAFLVHRVVLAGLFKDFPQIGWFIASIYLICGAFRLARFNCLAASAGSGGGKEFLGFPIPMAAGLVASLTFLLLWLDKRGVTTGWWHWILPPTMIFVSLMMVSEVKYPTFKSLDWRAQRSFPRMIIIVMVIGSFLIFREYLQFILPFLFIAYLVYGLIRPRISRKLRHDIEEEDDEEERQVEPSI